LKLLNLDTSVNRTICPAAHRILVYALHVPCTIRSGDASQISSLKKCYIWQLIAEKLNNVCWGVLFLIKLYM